MTTNGNHDDDFVLPADDNDFQTFRDLCKDGDNWTNCYKKKNITVETKGSSDSNIKLLRARATFEDVSAATIFDVVHDTTYRKKWDKDMINMTEICKLCVNNTISYYAVKCPTPVKPRDCLFLSSWLVTPHVRDAKEYIMINRSVSHKGYPPRKDMVRAISLNTGYLIIPTGPNSVDFTYISQFDPRGSLPKWVVNRVSQIFTPKVMRQIHKAAKKYPVWKNKHDPNFKPWIRPEQCRLKPAVPGELSSRYDMVDIVDELNVSEVKEESSPASDDDDFLY